MSLTVQEILARINLLPEEDRLALEEHLAQHADLNTGCADHGQPRYPLHGIVIRYDNPTEPISLNEWEALR